MVLWAALATGLVGCAEPPDAAVDRSLERRAPPADLLGACEAAMQCEVVPFPDVWLAACAEELAGLRDASIEAGCAEPFRTYVDCAAEAGTCVEGLAGGPACYDAIFDYVECYGDLSLTASAPSTYVPMPTGTTEPEPEPPRAGLVEGSAGCLFYDVVVEAAWAVGSHPVVEARVDLADTANVPHWYESHALAIGAGEPGYGYALEVLTPSPSFVPEERTLFDCIDHIDVDGPEVMTYVWRIHDTLGLADCWAEGHDPVGVLDHAYDTYGNDVARADLSPSSCTVVSWAD